MAILDNRTIYDSAESTTGWVDTAGLGTSFALDTELNMQGTNALSTSFTSTSAELGCLYNQGSAVDRSNTVWYLWFNFLAPGALDTQANGGVTVRFCGATVTDFFEIEVAGSDTYAGGPVQFVVDIEEASTNPFATGGTAPASSAIQYVGIVVNPLTAMPKMADNYAIDEIAFVLDTDPVILVEGQNTGSVDWTWDDVVSTAEASSWGTCKRGPGGSVVLSGPVRFGRNDAVTHGFSDTNQLILWEDQLVPDGFYFLEVIGGSGVQSFEAGVKTGTGLTATGGQGWVVAAAGTGDRWDFKGDDANLDALGIYGCTFQHGNDFQLDNVDVEVLNTLFLDIGVVEASNSNVFLKNNYINSSSAADASALIWNENADVDGILDGSTFSKGTAAHHGVTLGASAPLTTTFRGISNTGFNAADGQNDSFFYLSDRGSDQTWTINVINGTGNFSFKKQRAGDTVNVVIDPVTVSVNVKNLAQVNQQNARVLVSASAGPLPFEDSVTIVNATLLATVTHTAHGMVTGDLVQISGASHFENNGVFSIIVLTVNTYTYTMSAIPGSNPTGTIIATFVMLYGLTDVDGNISASRTLGAAQPIVGKIRKASSAPYFKTTNFVGTISATLGFSTNQLLLPDG